MDEARRRVVERRALVDDTTTAYARILETIVRPVFQTIAAALTPEGHRFDVETPAGLTRLVRKGHPEERIELALDTEREVPAIVLRAMRGRGSRMLAIEEVVAEGPAIAEITDSNLLDAIIQQLIPLLER